jgi:hypothetical protein
MRRLAEVDAGEPVMPKVRSADALDGPYPALKRCWQIATTCDGCGGSGSDKRQVRTIGRSARPVACGARLSSPRTTATAYTGRGVNVGHRWPANWGGVEEGRERLGLLAGASGGVSYPRHQVDARARRQRRESAALPTFHRALRGNASSASLTVASARSRVRCDASRRTRVRYVSSNDSPEGLNVAGLRGATSIRVASR